MSNRWTYEVDENFFVRIWDAECPLPDNAPNLFQDMDPRDGQPFESTEDATSWAEEFIQHVVALTAEEEAAAAAAAQQAIE